MSNGNNVEDVNTAIAAVTYSYPELKSNDNDKQLMNELSTTEIMSLSIGRTIINL